jgi:hypothetical protein
MSSTKSTRSSDHRSSDDRLSPDELDKLRELSRSLIYSCEVCARLEVRGLAETGRSRFGHWARITEAGRDFLKALHPGSDAGADREVGYSCRGAVPRNRRDTAIQARRDVAITPPAAALDVGETFQSESAGPSKAGIGVLDAAPVRDQQAPTLKQVVDRITEMVVSQYGKDNRRTGNRSAKQ